MEPKDIVKHIIESNYYLTLATTNGQLPWANPVFFASDKEYNLYFTSYNDAQHVQNIFKNPQVAVAIFDSHIVPGTGAQGVQIKGTCHRVIGNELSNAIDVVYSKRFSNKEERATRDLSIERFSQSDSEGRTDHIYKIIPEEFYILDRKVGKDTRIKVNVK